MDEYIRFQLPAAAVRLLREGSPGVRIGRAVRFASRERIGRGRRYSFTCDRTTAAMIADYLDSVAGAVGQMTASERDGGRESATAARAVVIIEAALRA